ncbi:MAG: hypothetical protein KC496_07930 [Anaerolineae bacterium]|nr:hypothetical protein [Anaerolineae bacterium]
MSISLSSIHDGTVMTIQYQPLFDATQDIWRSLRTSVGASVRVHDFSGVALTRVQMRQVLFLLRENDAQQAEGFHTVIVASEEQSQLFTDEMVKCPGRERLIPIFGKLSEAMVCAAMLIVKNQREKATL